jgi:hypothetical protein
MAAHAKLSASSSKKWLTCPPSASLERKFPDEQSPYASEGTLAHSYAEILLRCYLGGNDGADIAEAQGFEEQPECTQEMSEAVQIYVDICIEKINAALAISKDAVILLEERLDFSPWVPEGFGTGDMVIIADGLVEIVDLKYGAGVPISAEGNTQMRLYGLGAINQFDWLYDVQAVTMTIVQPRRDSISSETMKAEELLDWGGSEVQPIAKLAFDGKGDFYAGEHCKEGFCKARHTCRARAEKNLEIESYQFKEPLMLNRNEITDLLERLPRFIKWAKDVTDFAYDQALNHGATWPGWKLVTGISRRKFDNEGTVAQELIMAGYKDTEIYELRGIGELEKTIGKKQFGELLGQYIVKPPGKPVLVPESDKRPAINSVASAQADFS